MKGSAKKSETEDAPALTGTAHRIVPLIVATSLIMQQIDSTAVATALPSMAASMNLSSLSLHSVITAYLLSLGVFLPLSGWVADRMGARRVFCAAVIIFTLASVACALSFDLVTLIVARLIQGIGAAMMLPTARLILVRLVPRSELVAAMALMSMPAVIGPVVGPLVGGFITDVGSWRGIFWINLPVGIISVVMTLLLVKPIPPENDVSFDFRGFALSGIGIGALIFGLDSISRDIDLPALALVFAVGAACLGLYVRHALRWPAPILNLGLFRYRSFQATVFGGTLFRIGFGAMPFLLPLLMQEIFGYSPFQSGAITFVSAIGAFGMRALTRRILHRFGFRSVLLWNALLSSLSIALCAIFTHQTALTLMITIIFMGGVCRALQFTSLNSLAFAEVTNAEMSHSTTLSQVAQRVSQGLGVSIAAALLNFFAATRGEMTESTFAATFVAIAAITSLSCISFFKLPQTAGDVLTGRRQRREAA
ncbi:DHA2 family efflux MFS transporter permease subunit [Rhizobium puerariae]|uniref:DHA2 family efflux MFS transporter permease subunit n=1 Tax=Rhizobium puerariae TaxID=1585791 RepID=A0ABV6AJL8_9HYPH